MEQFPYNKIAMIIRAVRAEYENGYTARTALTALVYILAIKLADNDPQFDKEEFIDACRPEDSSSN